jgi:hypothetical protein
LISSFSNLEIQELQIQFKKHDADNSNSIKISKFSFLAQSTDFCGCIGGEANFKVLVKSADLLQDVLNNVMEQKDAVPLHHLKDAQHQHRYAAPHSEELPNHSLTFVEFVQVVLELRNKLEVRKEQHLAKSLSSRLKWLSKYLNKRQLEKQKKDKVELAKTWT